MARRFIRLLLPLELRLTLNLLRIRLLLVLRQHFLYLRVSILARRPVALMRFRATSATTDPMISFSGRLKCTRAVRILCATDISMTVIPNSSRISRRSLGCRSMVTLDQSPGLLPGPNPSSKGDIMALVEYGPEPYNFRSGKVASNTLMRVVLL